MLLTRQYIWYILAIGLCYTASLLCSNLAYLTLSVSFISMLKALAPVVTLVISYAGGFAEPTAATWAKVSLITFGVFLSSIGEVTFAWDGFSFQMFGTVSESIRLLLIGWLLTRGAAAAAAATVQKPQSTTTTAQGDYDEGRDGDGEGHQDDAGAEKPDTRRQDDDDDDVEAQRTVEGSGVVGMTPLLLLYYYAPVCAVFNVLMALMTEWRTFDVADLQRVGWSMLALNGAVAFMLNVSSVFLVRPFFSCPRSRPLGKVQIADNIGLKIGKTSALAMNLTGILKSVLLVLMAILIWSTPITFIQAVGYSIALVGLLLYALPDNTWKQSEVVEIALTHLGVYAVKIGNRLGLLGHGSNWGGRGSGGEGRYTSVPDTAFEEHDDSLALSEVEGGEEEGSKNSAAEFKGKLAKD